MNTFLFFLSLALNPSAYASPACRVLHVTAADAPPTFREARSQVEMLLRAKNADCAVITREATTPDESTTADDGAFDLIVVQNFTAPPDLSAFLRGVCDHLRPDGRVVVLARNPVNLGISDVVHALDTLKLRQASVYLWGGPISWPEPVPTRPRLTGGQIFWNAWAGLGAASFTAVLDGHGSLVRAGLYSLAAFAATEAVGALYDEARARRSTLPRLADVFDTVGTSNGAFYFSVATGFLFAAWNDLGIDALLTAPAFSSGVIGFALNHYFDTLGRRVLAESKQRAVHTQINQAKLHVATDAGMHEVRLGATDPRLYDCRSDLGR